MKRSSWPTTRNTASLQGFSRRTITKLSRSSVASRQGSHTQTGEQVPQPGRGQASIPLVAGKLADRPAAGRAARTTFSSSCGSRVESGYGDSTTHMNQALFGVTDPNGQ